MSDGLIITLVGLIGSLIVLITPLIKLNTNITTLNCNLESLFATVRRDEKELHEMKSTVTQHELDIGNCKKDIKILYRKTDDLEDRKE